MLCDGTRRENGETVAGIWRPGELAPHFRPESQWQKNRKAHKRPLHHFDAPAIFW